MEYPPPSPSRRQPDIEWYFNEADVIERQMQADGHQTWGYVIYRTIYSSGEDWAEFLRRLRFRMEKCFKNCNGQDIFELFTLIVFSDPTLFDGADTPTIRTHFWLWAESAFRTEQQPEDDSGREEVRMGNSPRYKFCVQVDAAAFHSVVQDAPAPPAYDVTKKGWVKLISKFWIPIEEDPRARPNPNVYEPIEGVTERDVGWDESPLPRVHGGVLLGQ